MSRKLIMPKCPHCNEGMRYRVGDYNTIQLVNMITGASDNVTIKCGKCGKDYKVSCSIRFYGKK